MRSVAVSVFKARCIALLKQVDRTRTPLVVTRRGRPLARIDPVVGPGRQRRLGALRARTIVLGDIVRFDFTGEWEPTRVFSSRRPRRSSWLA